MEKLPDVTEGRSFSNIGKKMSCFELRLWKHPFKRWKDESKLRNETKKRTEMKSLSFAVGRNL